MRPVALLDKLVDRLPNHLTLRPAGRFPERAQSPLLLLRQVNLSPHHVPMYTKDVCLVKLGSRPGPKSSPFPKFAVLAEDEPESIAIVKSILNLVALKGASVRGRWQAQRASRALRKSTAGIDNMIQLIEVAFQFDYHGIQIAPMQIQSELTAFLEFLAPRHPRRILEIGTARGGTFFLLSRAAAEDAHLITIDLPSGPFGADSYSWRRELIRCLGRERQRIDALRADSQRAETFERVKDLLAGETVDLLFIDGDHRHVGVKRDFTLYAPLVGKGGLIAFHDIVPGEEKYVGGVPHFWREVKADRPAREFVESWEQGGYGIGLLEIDR